MSVNKPYTKGKPYTKPVFPFSFSCSPIRAQVMTMLGYRAALSLLPAVVADFREHAFVQDLLSARYGGNVDSYCVENVFNMFRFYFLSMFARSRPPNALQKVHRISRSCFQKLLVKGRFRRTSECPPALLLFPRTEKSVGTGGTSQSWEEGTQIAVCSEEFCALQLNLRRNYV